MVAVHGVSSSLVEQCNADIDWTQKLTNLCFSAGAIAVGLFSTPTGQFDAGIGVVDDKVTHCGAFYANPYQNGARSGNLLAANIVGVIVVSAWTAVLISIMFFTFKMAGALRIPPEVEVLGNDISKHGGLAYPEESMETGIPQKDHLGMDKSLKIDEIAAKPTTSNGEEAA